jgi:endonuclease YncB( thermonuclease family)
MKLLSLLISLVLGAAVLLVLIRPWGALESVVTEPPVSAVPAASPPETPPALPEAKPPASPDVSTPAAEDGRPVSNPGQSQILLARERAEAQRSAALKEKDHAAAPAPPKTKRYFRVKVRDAGTLEVRLARSKTAVIRLQGIEVRGADETCERQGGTTWPCGAKARRALIALIRGRAVVCALPREGESDAFRAQCGVGGEDLSTWLVRQGWAMPKADTVPALGEALNAAKRDRLGFWAGN